ncbi:MAG: MBOAT family protein, partial [Bdellovibrionales bacterium]|nr:MBOAT family protein [Bdellovibrionales bacterium]
AWDVRFLSLILLSTIIDYFCGLKIAQSSEPRIRKRYVTISVFSNLLILGFFKYFDFFVTNANYLAAQLGLSTQLPLLEIILPVGISFYTFQTMSYAIDIYRKEVEPTQSFLDFALFVSFFPQLVAGPIERAKNLLPQVLGQRLITLDKFYSGAFLCFWGLFKKVYVADNLAPLVNSVFSRSAGLHGPDIIIALYAFAFQIYCDFSGYTDIARGTAKMMGFDLMFNFRLPYFASNPSEFWKRWHISLSSWLRDYLYIPLGGSKSRRWLTYRNLFLTMLLGGLWHGAAWTFVAWGIYQAILLISHRVAYPILNRSKFLNTFAGHVVCVVIFFQFICIGWLLFRAESISQALEFIQLIVNEPRLSNHTVSLTLTFLQFSWPLLIVQGLQAKLSDYSIIEKSPVIVRIFVYLLMMFLMIFWGVDNGQEFIYFQF